MGRFRFTHYEPDYTCECGRAFNIYHDEVIELYDKEGTKVGIACTCGKTVSK